MFAHLDGVDLLKLDIEGSEWEILGDARFRRPAARAVALEYHAHRCPAEDPASYAHGLLRRAGYRTADHEFHSLPGHGMIWAWRT